MRDIIRLKNPPRIISTCAFVGSEEKNGPMGDKFLNFSSDNKFGKDTWEKAESEMQRLALSGALKNGGITDTEVDILLAGDLLNQCIGSIY